MKQAFACFVYRASAVLGPIVIGCTCYVRLRLHKKLRYRQSLLDVRSNLHPNLKEVFQFYKLGQARPIGQPFKHSPLVSKFAQYFRIVDRQGT
jgi:hypothetical protein